MNPINYFLENSANRYPNKTAVIQDGDCITYNQLNTLADNLAGHLKTNGITQGDRIALLLENSIDYIIAYYATLKMGAVTAPFNPGLKPDNLAYLLNDLEPSALITSFKYERLLKAVTVTPKSLQLLIIKNPKQTWQNTAYPCVKTLDETLTQPSKPNSPTIPINPANLASIIYTSGSTGPPKGVMLSHSNIVSNTISICQCLSITEKDIQMVVLPFFYVMGKSLLNTHIAAGATVVINNRFLYPADVVNQMIAEKVTSFSGVPSTYAYLLHRSPIAACRDKLGHLRYCSQAGGHMAKSLKLNLRKTLPTHTQIVIMYGATEASARLTYLEPADFESKIDSIGKPIPDVSIRVLDENAKEVPDGRHGELVASGPNIMQGYWKAPKDSAHVLNNCSYRTGDIGYRDADGFLYIKQRKDGLLKVGGHRINPTEIEEFLMATDQLIETAVIGLSDQLMGNKLIALIVPKNEHCDSKNLMKTCAKGLPKHKHPTEIIPVRTLPKNASGKIHKGKCHQIALKTL
jgi:acyl-CoA synthetase (AMP-forming)/AMP-acid ligase II